MDQTNKPFHLPLQLTAFNLPQRPQSPWATHHLVHGWVHTHVYAYIHTSIHTYSLTYLAALHRYYLAGYTFLSIFLLSFQCISFHLALLLLFVICTITQPTFHFHVVADGQISLKNQYLFIFVLLFWLMLLVVVCLGYLWSQYWHMRHFWFIVQNMPASRTIYHLYT